MGGSCGQTIVQMIEYIINRRGRLYEKKNAHAWQKEMHIVEYLGTKEENPLKLCT